MRTRAFWLCYVLLCFGCSNGSDGLPDGNNPNTQEPDDTPGDSVGPTFLITGNWGEPCWVANGNTFCPKDTNLDLVRIDFDLETGERTEVRLTANSDGTHKDLQGLPAPDDDIFLTMSEDFEWVYFENYLSGSWDLFRVKSDGSGAPEPVIASEHNDLFMSFSPDESHVWFVRDGVEKPFNIYVKPTAGGPEEQVTDFATNVKVEALLRPNNSGLIFSVGSGADTDGSDKDVEYYTLRYSDRTVERITNNDTKDVLAGFSSDGQSMFFVTRDVVEVEVEPGVIESNLWGPPNLWKHSISAPGSEVKLTSIERGWTLDPMAVLEDGKRLIFEWRDPEGNGKQVFSVNTETAESKQISDPVAGASSFYRAMSFDESLVLYTTNDRPHLRRWRWRYRNICCAGGWR